MPEIPLHLPGQIAGQFQPPRTIAKGAMVANLGAAALSVNNQLQDMIFKDRERRDYNEQLIAAQNALNGRNMEALQSNNPRTMLDDFNTSIEKDYDQIRSRIKNPLLRQDFNFQTSKGLANARVAILGHQLKLERQESEQQRIAFADSMMQSAALDGSSDNLLEIRDRFKDITDHAVQTGDMTETEAYNWGQMEIGRIEQQIIKSAIDAGQHDMISSRLLSGEFPSVKPNELQPLLSAIHKHKQDENFTDWFMILDNGGASRAQEKKILQDARDDNLTEAAARSLLSKNRVMTDRKIAEGVSLEHVHNARSRMKGVGLYQGSADHRQNVTNYAIANIDRKHMEAGLKGRALWEARTAEVDAFMGLMPEHWRLNAYGAIKSSQTDPEGAVAASRMIAAAFRGDRAVYSKMDAEDPGLGSKAHLMSQLSRGGLSAVEAARAAEERDQIARTADGSELISRFNKRVTDDRGLVGNLLATNITDDPTVWDQLGGKTIGGFSSSAGQRLQLKPGQGAYGEVIKDYLERTQGIGTDSTGRNLVLSSDRTFTDMFGHLGAPGVNALEVPEDMLTLYEELTRSEFLSNGGFMKQAGEVAFKKLLQTYQPSSFGGEGRWMMGAPEFHLDPIDGSLDWARNQVIATAQAQLMDVFKGYRNLEGVFPEFRGLNDLPAYWREWTELFAAAHEDEPDKALQNKSWSAASWELAVRAVGSLVDAGANPQAGPGAIFNQWFSPRGPKIRLTTTPELMNYKPDPVNRPDWTVVGYHVAIENSDGTFTSMAELPGGDEIYKIFYFDKDLSPEGAKEKYDSDTRLLRSIMRHEILQGNDEASIRQELAERGFSEELLTNEFAVHDFTDYFELVGQAGFGRTNRPKPLKPGYHIDRPAFDRERYVSENPP